MLESEKEGYKKTAGKLRDDMKRLEMDRHREVASSEALRVELQRTVDVLKSANERLQVVTSPFIFEKNILFRYSFIDSWIIEKPPNRYAIGSSFFRHKRQRVYIRGDTLLLRIFPV